MLRQSPSSSQKDKRSRWYAKGIDLVKRRRSSSSFRISPSVNLCCTRRSFSSLWSSTEIGLVLMMMNIDDYFAFNRYIYFLSERRHCIFSSVVLIIEMISLEIEAYKSIIRSTSDEMNGRLVHTLQSIIILLTNAFA